MALRYSPCEDRLDQACPNDQGREVRGLVRVHPSVVAYSSRRRPSRLTAAGSHDRSLAVAEAPDFSPCWADRVAPRRHAEWRGLLRVARAYGGGPKRAVRPGSWEPWCN